MVDKNDPLQGIEINVGEKYLTTLAPDFPKSWLSKRSLLHVKRLQPEDPKKKHAITIAIATYQVADLQSSTLKRQLEAVAVVDSGLGLVSSVSSESVTLPFLKLTANAPENRGPLEKEIPIGNHHF